MSKRTREERLQEVYEDAIDWMQRWQAGRRKNTEAQKRGTLNAGQVILDAAKMNRELDSILHDYKKLVPTQEHP